MPSVLCSVILLGLVAPAHAAVFSFDDAAVPVGDNPQSFSVANCDLDGLPDIVAAGFDADTVTVFLNSGPGTLMHHATIPTPPQPAGATCGDFTGDGLSDLAVSSWANGTLTIYRAEENGDYTPLDTLNVGTQPRSVTSADLNVDGKLDLVVVNSGSSDITVLFGNGSGGFPSIANIRLPSTNQDNRPRAAAVADFDGNGKPDIAVASQGRPSLRLLLGDGLGFHFFEPQANLPAAGRLIGIAAADYNDDTIPDLALLAAETSGDSAVSLYTGTGTGTFVFDTRIPVRAASKSVALADFNGDGLVDIALSYSDANAVHVVRALAPGRFPACGSFGEPFECPASPAVNGIGNVQLRITDDANQLIFVDGAGRHINLLEMENLGTPRVTPLLSTEEEPQSILLANMTGDSSLDAVVVAGTRRSMGLTIYPGNAAGGFLPPPPTSDLQVCGNGIVEGSELCDDGNVKKKDGCSPTCHPEAERGLLALEAADIDADGLNDLIVVDGRGRLRLFYGDGQGRFPTFVTLGTVKRKSNVGVGDYTGDGRPDIAFLPKRTRDGALQIFVNEGGGVFTTTNVVLPGRTPRLAGPILTADVDRNGFADLILQHGSKPKGVAVLYSKAGAPLSTLAATEVPRGMTSLAGADFNEDGWLDVVVQFKSRRRSPMLLFGSPGTALIAGPTIPVSDGRTHLTIVDVDEDLHHDLVACSDEAACSILYGDGAAHFRNNPLPASPAIGRDVRGAAVADFDEDGHIDLAGVSRRDSIGRVHFSGPNPLDLDLVTGTKPGALDVADFNNDGREDLVAANEGSQDVSIFTNAGTPAAPRQFNTLARVKLPAGGSGPVALAVGDVNNDGTLDIAVTQGTSPRVTILRNTAGAGFAASVNLVTGAGPRGVTLGRLNADAILDIVTANHDANTLSVFLSQAAGDYVRTDIPSGGVQPWDVEALDMDGDGYDEVVALNGLRATGATEGSLVTFHNAGDGSGTLTPSVPHVVHGREIPTTMCVGDFDGDSILDLAIASVGTADISVLHGNGIGAWSGDRRCIAAGEPVSAVSCNDADRDGMTDIAFGRRRGADVGAIMTGDLQ